MLLSGVVEVDEAFIGKRRSGNQQIVIGAFERDSQRVHVQIIPHRSQKYTDRFIVDTIEQPSVIYTDAYVAYINLDIF